MPDLVGVSDLQATELQSLANDALLTLDVRPFEWTTVEERAWSQT